MTSHVRRADSVLETKIAEKYQAQGYKVILDPRKSELPFDLGNYRPDMIVEKSPQEHYIIEVKSSVSQMPIDRYREIAELVAQHAGWSFLLVTEEDVSQSAETKGEGQLLSWEQIYQRQKQAERLMSLGEIEGAFISFWGTLEAVLRRQAKKMSIPIERLPTLSLINHLYSQGELSMEQFDRTRELQSIRNRFVHGYQAPSLSEPTKRLQELISELVALWGS
jgi:hypothetical protein